MTVGATEQKVFHSLTQNCTLKMEKSQQISTENPQINVCTYFHHLATQHISLTTYIIYIENCVRIFFSAGITIHQLWTPNLSLHRAWNSYIQSSNTSKKIEINGTFNCKTRNEVYCITCEQCKLQYIGQTARSLDERVR